MAAEIFFIVVENKLSVSLTPRIVGSHGGRNYKVSGIRSVQYRNEKNADAGTSPDPE
jgi:hypothetical protein